MLKLDIGFIYFFFIFSHGSKRCKSLFLVNSDKLSYYCQHSFDLLCAGIIANTFFCMLIFLIYAHNLHAWEADTQVEKSFALIVTSSPYNKVAFWWPGWIERNCNGQIRGIQVSAAVQVHDFNSVHLIIRLSYIFRSFKLATHSEKVTHHFHWS